MKTTDNWIGASLKRVVRAPDYALKNMGVKSQRQWRARKRKDLKAAIKAFGEYRRGCAFCPGINGEVGAIETLLASLWESHKEKNWPWRSNDPSSAAAKGQL